MSDFFKLRKSLLLTYHQIQFICEKMFFFIYCFGVKNAKKQSFISHCKLNIKKNIAEVHIDATLY